VGGLAAIVEQASRKRRAEEGIERPIYARCENREQRYDVKETDFRSCFYHLGMSCTSPRRLWCNLIMYIGYKTLDGMSDFWADHDERCHGICSSFIDDPDYVEGFMWSCCENAMDERGCKRGAHKLKHYL
jgi:hypothetical protein